MAKVELIIPKMGESVSEATIITWAKEIGDVVEIPVGMKHRVENKFNKDLIFIETQTGSYFGEDDIVRLDDDYGRNK